jgi:hypothetical protein
MKKLLAIVRTIQRNFDEKGYVVKNHEGSPFFGEIHITITDGKITYSKNKSKEDINVVENVKI